MSSLCKRPALSLEAALSINNDPFSTKESSEPPRKKPRNSPGLDSHADSGSAGGPLPVTNEAATATAGHVDDALNAPQDGDPDGIIPVLGPDKQATTTAAYSSYLSDDGLDSDEFESVEPLLTAPLSDLATPTAKRVTTSRADTGLYSDEFEPVEHLLTAPLSDLATPAAKRVTTSRADTGLYSDVAKSPEIATPAAKYVAHNQVDRESSAVPYYIDVEKADKKFRAGFYSGIAKSHRVATPVAKPVVPNRADRESRAVPYYFDVHNKSHRGRVSEVGGAIVIDLTEDDDVEVTGSDGFVGVIYPGTPGNRMKHEGSFSSPSVRRTLNPVLGNTPAPHYNWEDRKSIYSTPSKPAPAYAGLQYSSPLAGSSWKSENVENRFPYYAGATPSPGQMQGMSSQYQLPRTLKYEDTRALARDCKAGLVKSEDRYNTPHRPGQPASSPSQSGSPKPAGFDMAKFIVNEQKLAAMPSAEQPSQLKTKLLPHQRQALHWMIGMEQQKTHPSPSSRLVQSWGRNSGHNMNPGPENSTLNGPQAFSGGILADDMGLGKTLEMIALILTEHRSGPTLIVAPKGVLSNWESQIRRHIQWNHAPRLFRFHGPRCHVTPDELGRNDIVITTYNKLGDEAHVEGTLRQVWWRRVVLDEGHTIRNPDSLASLAACQLQAKSRWACTGTPIINSENDIHSLSKFIGANATLNKGNVVIARRLKNDHEFLQNVMTILCLRRTKDMSFINLDLPPKQEELVRIEFSEAEKGMYKKLFEDAQQAAELFFQTRNYALWNNLLERLLRLRQMCDHWTLCRKKDMEKEMEKDRKEFDELISVSAGKPDASQLGELLRLSLEAKMACGICNEPVDAECRPAIVPCGHVFCRSCVLTRLQKVSTCPLCNHVISMADVHESDSATISSFEVPASNDHSAKTKALMALVKERLQNKGSKVVIFSQWTSFLDIISRQMDEEGVGHTRIDGTMSTTARDEAVRTLQGDPNTRVMLASLRAAGVGISLVAADTVIVSDSWWAPAVEEQAVDRVHRLGQTRPTKVYRLVIKDAVEESVIRIQDRKRELVGTAFQEDFKSLSKVNFTNMIKELLR